MTPPPPDSEEDLEEARVLEAQARRDLEAEGCPPCYPADIELPIVDPPAEFRSIIRYFENDGVYLCAQLSEWKRFCVNRGRSRSLEHEGVFLRRLPNAHAQSPSDPSYMRVTFDQYVRGIRRRRERHELPGDVSSIQPLLSQQGCLGNWMEYQDYAIKCLHGFCEDKEELEKERDEGLAKGEESWPYERRMEYLERETEKHKVLMQWIEEQRLVMVREQQQQRQRQQGSQDSRRSPHQPQKRQRSCSSISGTSGISKHETKRPSPRSAASRKPKAKTRVPDAVGREAKRTTRHRNTKEGQRAEQGNNGRKRTRKDPDPQTSKTRSGRASKPPARWTPT